MNQGFSRTIDIGTILGVMCAFGLVFYAIHLGGSLKTFIDAQSLLIVFGGTMGATLINFPLRDLFKTFGSLKTAFFPDRLPHHRRIGRIVHFARRLRSEAPEAIRDELDEEHDVFFRQCLELLADKVDEKEIRKVMSIDLTMLEDRHRRGAHLFQTMGTIAPAMGLVGTLIGLVQMLRNLESPESIGPAMAVALLTTFYGAMLANIVFIPIAGKLRTRSEEEVLLKELTLEGVVALAQGFNPHTIERRLLSFLPPDKRISEYD